MMDWRARLQRYRELEEAIQSLRVEQREIDEQLREFLDIDATAASPRSILQIILKAEGEE